MSAIVERLEPEIRQALDAGQLENLRETLAEQHPADLADVLERLDPEQQLEVFQFLPTEQQAEVLDQLGGRATQELLTRLPVEHVGDLLDELPMDDAAEILTEDVPELQEQILAAMETEDAAEVKRLLQYPPHSAGLLMTERYVQVRPSMTVAEVMQHLRQIDEEVETISDLYVVNGQKRLMGVLSLRELLRHPPYKRVEEFMETNIISVTPETDQEPVARLVARYHFLAIPVVDEDNHMLGIITVDDVIDVLTEESTEDILRFGAVEGGATIDQPYFTIPMVKVLRSRVGWLLLLFLAETLTGTVLRAFEHELAAVVALSFFIPLLIGTGGNTGAQTVSTIIRGIALREIRLSDTWRVVMRELSGGFLIGLLLGIVAFFRTILWGGLSLQFCLVIGLTILGICTWANTIGAIIPLIAHRLKIDPAVVSAPLITTLVDATGLAIYFLIAKVILGL
jgi:magnesium transporter